MDKFTDCVRWLDQYLSGLSGQLNTKYGDNDPDADDFFQDCGKKISALYDVAMKYDKIFTQTEQHWR